MATKSTEKFNFETALEKLTGIVEKMESGNLSLEDSLKYFEQGISLTRQCQQALQQAEQKVQILLEKDGAIGLADFATEENA